nr:annexin [Hymenolepis microstoma]
MSGQRKIHSQPRFNAKSDAIKLFAVLQGVGKEIIYIVAHAIKNYKSVILETDEGEIIKILTRRRVSQRKEIATRYKYMYGEHLERKLACKLKGKLKETIISLTKDVHELKVRGLRNALTQCDIDSQTLIQILISASNEEICSLKQTYRKLFGVELELDIEKNISGDFQYILKLILQGKREKRLAIGDGKLEEEIDMLSLGKEEWDMPKEFVFSYILCSRSFQHIKALAKVYAYKSKETLIETIQRETTGHCCETLVSIVQYALDPLLTYVKWIRESIEASGTRDKDLIRLIMTRAETDIEDIKKEYLQSTGKNLSTAIRSEISGDYKDVLIAIVEGSKHI